MIHCKICLEKFDKPISLTYHFKKIHNLTKKEYVIKTEYNGNNPLCACGCGNMLKWNEKKKFLTFFGNHMKYVPINSLRKSLPYKRMKIEERLSIKNIDINLVKECYNFYINF